MNPVDLVRDAIESLNTDTTRFYECLSDDVIFEPFGVVGPEACRSIDQPLWDAVPDHHRVVERAMSDGDCVYTWTRFTGTAPNGSPLVAEVNGHYVVREDKIIEMRLYFDPAQLAP
jgi:hypothetical protein